MIELASIFDRAVGPRLNDAEKFIIAWPTLFATGLSRCELAFRKGTHSLLAVAHFDEKRFGPEIEQRFQFWASQCGGRALSTYLLRDGERAVFEKQLSQCEIREKDLTPDKIIEAFNRVAVAVGLGQRRTARIAVELEVDLGANGGLSITRDVSEGGVFVLSTACPPLGDRFLLKLKVPTVEKPFELEVKVAHARLQAGRMPQGFGVQFLSPSPELARALTTHFEAKRVKAQLESRRTSTRHPISAPVRITPLEAPAAEILKPSEHLKPTQPRPTAPPSPLAVTYSDAATAQEDYVKNLSHGGAFIRSKTPLPLETRVMLDFNFPKGLSLRMPGKVVHSHSEGMGVQFELDEAGKAQLASIIQKLTELPMRVLVVESDAQLRAKLVGSLKNRSFEVLEADSAQAGLNTLLEELLNLNVVLCRQSLPPLNGRTLVDLIRRAGGESDLALVVITDEGPPTDVAVNASIALTQGPQRIAERVLEVCQAVMKSKM